MKQKDKNKARVVKKAASIGVNLKVGKKSSGKVLFPEKVEQANKILSNTKFRYVK